ncbi:MAG TPA: cytochrome P450 [Thermoanaerobaculia bacterium]|nr:cytochrome P450 [Thermoanaerobaculia bacterium]
MRARETCAADPFAAEAMADPYPALERLRSESPVAWHERGMWIVTPHAEVSALLRDPRYQHWRGKEGGDGARESLAAHFGVTPRQSMREIVRRRAASLLEPLAGRGVRVELMREYAHPLTFSIAAELCGIPGHEIPSLSDLAVALDCNVLLALQPDRLPEPMRSAATELRRRIEAALETTSSRSIGVAIRTHAGDKRAAAAAMLIVLYAGHRNMMNAIGNAVVALDRHPGVLAQVQRMPQLLDRGVHELLRYDSPLQYISIVGRETALICGQRIEAGDEILLAIGAANRDPFVFRDPNSIALNRYPNQHLSFGIGSMRCPGSYTAVAELSAALEALFTILPSLRVDGPVEWLSEPLAQRGPAAVFLRLGNA